MVYGNSDGARKLPSHSHGEHEGAVNARLVDNRLPVPPEPLYDVAISYLQTDSFLASSLAARLAENLKVFYYPRTGERLLGTEPIELIRAPFLFGSRVILLLYRADWGQTDWTRVEQSAIEEACNSQGWSKLFFVELERHRSPPDWLPGGHVTISLDNYDMNQLVGAIKVRVQERGGTITKSGFVVERADTLSNTDELSFSDRSSVEPVPQIGKVRQSRGVLRQGELEVDLDRVRVRHATTDVPLAPTEFSILQFLMKNPGHVFSRRQLMLGVWGRGANIDERTIDVLVGRIRRAFKARNAPDPIRTVRGLGYALNEIGTRLKS
jgi:Transcriptional regulatory protein, C terminal